ncbi:MAG: cohesin domain-containing protein [Chloroflexota bacterium]
MATAALHNQTVDITVTITEVTALADLDGDDIFCGEADFYAVMKIDGSSTQTDVIENDNIIFPQWQQSISVLADATQATATIGIQLFDKDENESIWCDSADDRVLINQDQTDITLILDLHTCEISGDITYSCDETITSQGANENHAEIRFYIQVDRHDNAPTITSTPTLMPTPTITPTPLGDVSPTATPTATVTTMARHATVAGCVRPLHALDQVVSGLPISLTNMHSAQDTVITTGEDGCYSASVEPGDYVVTPAKTGIISTIINVWDSTKVALYDARKWNFSTEQLTICDVTSDGNCTAFDAAQIALYRIDPALTDTNTIAGQFASEPYTHTFISLDSGDLLTNQDYELYLAGDVTLDWPETPKKQSLFAAAQTQAIVVKLPSITTTSNSSMNLPVEVENIDQQGILGYELFISFDPDIITVEDVTTENSITSDIGWATQKGIKEEGEVRVVSYGTSPLQSDGVLFNIVATANSDTEGNSLLAVSHIMFNDGQPITEIVDGQVTVEQAGNFYYLPFVGR